MFQAPDDPVAFAIAVLNTWDELEDPPELLRDVEALRRLLARNDLAALADRVRAPDLARVRRVRERLRRAFEARDEADAVNALNEILGSAKARPRLVRNRAGWKFEYVGRDPADMIGANAAASLLEAIRDDGWDRFGTCDAAPCCCVYVDRSKNRRRRYCSQPCTDRAAHAAFRRRRRAGG